MLLVSNPSSNLVAALRDVADVRLGMAFRSRLEHDPKGDVAVLQMKDISESEEPAYSQATRIVLPQDKQRMLLQPGDLVFRSRGTSNGAALVGSRVPLAVLAAPLLLIRPRKVLPAYLLWFLNSGYAQAQLASFAAGTSVQMISAESLRLLPIPLPPTAAQERIAEVAALIQREEDLMVALTRHRKQLATHILLDYTLKAGNGVTR